MQIQKETELSIYALCISEAVAGRMGHSDFSLLKILFESSFLDRSQIN